MFEISPDTDCVTRMCSRAPILGAVSGGRTATGVLLDHDFARR